MDRPLALYQLTSYKIGQIVFAAYPFDDEHDEARRWGTARLESLSPRRSVIFRITMHRGFSGLRKFVVRTQNRIFRVFGVFRGFVRLQLWLSVFELHSCRQRSQIGRAHV